MGVNKIILVGYVGADPELKELDNGAKVVSFTLATSESYKDKEGNKVDSTEWHNIVIWNKLADVVDKYVKKGSLLYLEGKSTNRSWEDKEGIKKYRTEVIVNNMQMLGGKKDSDSGSTQEPEKPSEDEVFDDLPF